MIESHKWNSDEIFESIFQLLKIKKIFPLETYPWSTSQSGFYLSSSDNLRRVRLQLIKVSFLLPLPALSMKIIIQSVGTHALNGSATSRRNIWTSKQRTKIMYRTFLFHLSFSQVFSRLIFFNDKNMLAGAKLFLAFRHLSR